MSGLLPSLEKSFVWATLASLPEIQLISCHVCFSLLNDFTCAGIIFLFGLVRFTNPCCKEDHLYSCLSATLATICTHKTFAPPCDNWMWVYGHRGISKKKKKKRPWWIQEHKSSPGFPPPLYLAGIQNNDHSVIVHRFPLRLLRARRAVNCSSLLAQVNVCLHT